MALDPLVRFARHYEVDAASGCWVWTAARNHDGYGRFQVKTADGSWKLMLAHRFAHETYSGTTIPAGMQVDHLCDNPPCVNPAHLRVATPRQNSLRSNSFAAKKARQTACVHGHPFTPENTYTGRGIRECRACRRRRVAVAQGRR